ncbi:MAG: outer membrane beta-barrel protein [Bacteroidetes bacterium]|nr:outer membrane beta-barrel protein [Bacteroidota bacterium]
MKTIWIIITGLVTNFLLLGSFYTLFAQNQEQNKPSDCLNAVKQLIEQLEIVKRGLENGFDSQGSGKNSKDAKELDKIIKQLQDFIAVKNYTKNWGGSAPRDHKKFNEWMDKILKKLDGILKKFDDGSGRDGKKSPGVDEISELIKRILAAKELNKDTIHEDVGGLYNREKVKEEKSKNERKVSDKKGNDNVQKIFIDGSFGYFFPTLSEINDSYGGNITGLIGVFYCLPYNFSLGLDGRFWGSNYEEWIYSEIKAISKIIVIPLNVNCNYNISLYNEHWSPYFGIGTGISLINSTTELSYTDPAGGHPIMDKTSENRTSWDLDVMAGLDFYLNSKLGITLNGNYLYIPNGDKDDLSGLGVQIGMKFFMPCKSK